MQPNNYRLWLLAIGLCTVSLISGLTTATGLAAPLTTFETTDFSGSGVCAFCHSNLRDAAGNDVSNDAQWRSTMMANSAKDPLWQAKISAEVALVPGGLGLEQVIQEKCSRCHMSMGRYQQLADGDTKYDIYVLGTGFLDPAHYLHDAAMDGVSCTLCHQVQPGNLGTVDSFTGQYEIDTATVRPDRLIFGPYPRPMINPMQQNTGFKPTDHAPASQLANSAHCGTCHTLYTPALDAQGNILGEFPEQTTYLEWEHSRMVQTCQDCHLPDADGAVVISNRPRRLRARDPFGQHHYVGGNSFMVDLIRKYPAEVGVTAETVHLDATLSRTLVQLQEATANLTAAYAFNGAGDRLRVTLAVENLAGHKLPSGLPSRRAWLHVTLSDASGTILFESGKPLPDGRIEGNDGNMDPNTFEPHHDTITTADQVQIYEPVIIDSDGMITHTLLRALAYVKDNRLLPAGFNKGSADADIGVFGLAANDGNFKGGVDEVVYEWDVSTLPGELTVTAELLYQTLSFPFVEDLRGVQTDLVGRFMGLYDTMENTPVVVATTQLAIP